MRCGFARDDRDRMPQIGEAPRISQSCAPAADGWPQKRPNLIDFRGLLDTVGADCYDTRSFSFLAEESTVKRTFQPHNKRRKRTHGFRKRMKTRGGRLTLQRRRRKGRRRLSVAIAKK